MKRRLSSLTIFVAAAISGHAAVAPIFINDAPLIAPPAIASNINATVWLNRSLYDITSIGNFNLPVPYESQNTRFFTNTASTLVNGFPVGGVMLGDPGYRFFRNTNGQRFPMDWWVNEGTIVADHDTLFSTLGINFFISDSSYSILQVSATNIVSSGPLYSGAHGLIRLEGSSIDLLHNTLRTGRDNLGATSIGGGGFATVGASNYVNDVGITDLQWGIGINNTINNQGPAMPVAGQSAFPNFNLPNPTSPNHQVQTIPGGFPSTTIVPSTFFVGTNVVGTNTLGGYTAAVFTNTLSPTSSIIQVVFYPSNFADTNFTVDVRFAGQLGGPGFEEAALVIVGFHSFDFDVVNQVPTPNSIYLLDAMAVNTNSFLARNLGGFNTRRPGTYEITRITPADYLFGSPGNTPLTSNIFFNANYSLRNVTNRYAAYAAQVDLLSSSPSGNVPYDPTNMPGRIEILGDRVNFEQTRIRAESAVIIKANNLSSNRLAQVDAPFVSFDGRSIHPELVISNLAPTTVRRMNGFIRAWSGQWRNFEAVNQGTNTATNTVVFHVLIVDPQLQTQRPVLVNEFAARAASVVVHDLLNIGKSFLVQGDSFHLTGGLNTPVGINLAAHNLVGLLNFTNDGNIVTVGSQRFGTDRPTPYNNYVNHGANSASAHFIRTENFENSGSLVANGGVFELEADTATLAGVPLVQTTVVFTNILGTVFSNVVTVQSGSLIQGVSEVRLESGTLSLSNSTIRAGTLYVDVTDQLTDFGTNAINNWSVTGGFRVNTLPTTSDLFGTYLTSAAIGLARHEWAGADFGAVPDGFVNNLALGKLTLNGNSNSLFRFFGTTGGNAIYVDYLELLNSATDINRFLSIDPSLTIYFANANIPANRLDGAANGRIQWVPDFTGPLSSTNITYSSGVTYTFNIAKVTSLDLDSDGDGIVNGLDPEPILVSSMVSLNVNLISAPLRAAELQWRALAYSRNIVEFKSSAGASAWQVLTNFVKNEFTTPVSVVDPLTTNGSTRVYRLRVEPQN